MTFEAEHKLDLNLIQKGQLERRTSNMENKLGLQNEVIEKLTAQLQEVQRLNMVDEDQNLSMQGPHETTYRPSGGYQSHESLVHRIVDRDCTAHLNMSDAWNCGLARIASPVGSLYASSGG